MFKVKAIRLLRIVVDGYADAGPSAKSNQGQANDKCPTHERA